MPNCKIDNYMTTAELSEKIKFKPNTIAKWRITKQEVIPYIKTKGRILYSETAVSEWLQKRTITH